MAKRKIIKIDQSRCTGCGECITACAESAIELKDGKAHVIRDSFCDGLGACLAVCPEGALTIEERDAEDFDLKAAKEHQGKSGSEKMEEMVSPCTAPITLHPATQSARRPGRDALARLAEARAEGTASNQLCSWPIQMRLVQSAAPYLKGASLLVAGDCTAFAYPAIQQDFLRGRVALVGCPKLDEKGPFLNKLAEILQDNDIRDITVLHMTVPCCAQLNRMVAQAVSRSGKDVPVKSFVVGIDGTLNAEGTPQ
jgi:Pyruvate/2-oxoacid:ferredoxin oxidoreductase delta subunit